MIKFNSVTWYSKLAAIIVFLVILPTITFYIGMKYQEVQTFAPVEMWQTYTNEKFGYSIQLPVNWYIDTTNSNTNYGSRGNDVFPLHGGDTQISNYSTEQIRKYHEENGPMDLPDDYMSVNIIFEKMDLNLSLTDYVKLRYESLANVTNINLSGTPAIRKELRDLDGLGGDSKPHVVVVIAKSNEHVALISYGYRDDQQALNTVAEKIMNSFTLTVQNEKADGIINAAYVKNGKNYIDIDYINFRHEKGDMPWGTIVNDNPQIRTFEVSPDALIKLSNKKINGVMTSGEYVAQFNEFKDIFNSKEDFRGGNPWVIVLKNGVVIEIQENFRS